MNIYEHHPLKLILILDSLNKEETKYRLSLLLERADFLSSMGIHLSLYLPDSPRVVDTWKNDWHLPFSMRSDWKMDLARTTGSLREKKVFNRTFPVLNCWAGLFQEGIMVHEFRQVNEKSLQKMTETCITLQYRWLRTHYSSLWTDHS